MPSTAPEIKRKAVKGYGGEITICPPTIKERQAAADKIIEKTGATFLHPSNDLDVILGQATAAIELLEDHPDLDYLLAPIGGGGLIAGIAAAVKQLQPNCLVFGVEPSGACGMQQSVAQGAPMEQVVVDTIADSLGAPMHAPLTFANVRDHVDELVQVSDDELRAAMRQMFDDMKLAVEPACAAALAAMNRPLAARLADKRVALIACGSNIDMASYQRLLA